MVKLALRMYEDSVCRCGHSRFLTQRHDAAIAYRAVTETCVGCATGERERSTEKGAGKITYVQDLRDTPGAMDLDADDIMWMPDDDSVPVDARYTDAGLDKYALNAPAAATSNPTMATTAAIMPLDERASEHSSEK